MSARFSTISVIIPNYNYEKTLGVCLESVYAQTMPPDEVIVSDDASTDGSRGVAARFPCRVLRAPRNRGVSAARNAGVAASTGDLLVFLDSDQALAPDAIENAVDLLSGGMSGEEYGLVHGVPAPEPLVDDGPVEWFCTLHIHYARRRAVGDTASAIFSAAAMRRSVFETVGPFDENLRDYEDVEYSERLAAEYRVGISERIVSYHDEEDRLLALLREQFRRAQLLLPFAAKHRRRQGALKSHSGFGLIAAVLSVTTLPAFLVSPFLLTLPPLFMAVFAASDPGLSRFMLRSKGWRFLCYSIGVRFLLNLALAAGAAVGGVRAILDRDFGRPAVQTRHTDPTKEPAQ